MNIQIERYMDKQEDKLYIDRYKYIYILYIDRQIEIYITRYIDTQTESWRDKWIEV